MASVAIRSFAVHNICRFDLCNELTSPLSNHLVWMSPVLRQSACPLPIYTMGIKILFLFLIYHS